VLTPKEDEVPPVWGKEGKKGSINPAYVKTRGGAFPRVGGGKQTQPLQTVDLGNPNAQGSWGVSRRERGG